MNQVRLVPRLLPLTALALAFLAVPAAFAQGANAKQSQCRNLKQTQYWQVAYQIGPLPNPVPAITQQATDGFTINSNKNADGTITIDIERTGQSDAETNEKPDQDDIKVNAAKQRLYFLEGQAGDDAYGIDTHLNDEAVVLTDLNGCILQ